MVAGRLPTRGRWDPHDRFQQGGREAGIAEGYGQKYRSVRPCCPALSALGEASE